MSEVINPARWTYAVYSPKTFGLGEVNEGAFFHVRCVYGDTKLEANIRAMEFIREASRVQNETGLTPRQLAGQRDALAEALDEICGLSRALRVGGPDAMDLEELSDALSSAVDMAHAALALVKGVTP